MLIDTHCHIHESDYSLNAEEVHKRAQRAGVNQLICVGTNQKSSTEAVAYAGSYKNCWASIGLHPHEAKDGKNSLKTLENILQSSSPHPSDKKIVAIGECGLDYYYNNSPREIQIEMLHEQISLALEFDLPLIFHVREAFDDFWNVFHQYSGIRGVLHSFTDSQANLDKALERGLFIGVNGISTFTKIESQQQMFASIPLKNLVLETDAPFLTPSPKRGRVNEPALLMYVAENQARLRGMTTEELAIATSQNATTLFNLKYTAKT